MVNIILYGESNLSITIEQIKSNASLFVDAKDSIKKNKAFVLSMVDELYYPDIDESLQKDKEVALAFLKKRPIYINLLPEILTTDKSFVRSMMEEAECGLRYAKGKQRLDRRLVLLSLKHSTVGYMNIGRKLRENEDFIKEALAVNGQVLEHLDKKYRADKEWVLLALKSDGIALQYASNMLRSDEDVVIEALKQNSYAFEYAHRYLKQDRKYVLKLIEKGYEIIDWIDEKLQADTLLVEKALRYDTNAFFYVDKNLINNRDFILKMLTSNGDLLYYLDEKFKKDKELVSLSVKQSPYSLNYADITLQHDKAFLLELIEQSDKVLEYIDEKVWKDKDFLLKILKEKGFGLEYASKEQQDNRTLVMKALAYDGYALEYANERFKKDKKAVLKSLNHYAYPLSFADKSLREDRAFMEKAIDVNSYSILYASKALKEDKNLVLLSIKENQDILEDLAKLKNDKAFVTSLLKDNLNVFPYVSESLKSDQDLIKLNKQKPHKYEETEEQLLNLSILFFLLFLYFRFLKIDKNKSYLLWSAILLFIVVQVLKTYFTHGVFRMPYQLVDSSHKFGLEPIRCWMKGSESLENLECYNMHVPEIYNDENSRVITFPVRVFRSSEMFSFKAPLLHLGGGGPGGDMQLDEDYALEIHLADHDAFSVNDGRDFFIIDPRGAGLSKPLLNCGTYVDNFIRNMKKEQSVEEEQVSIESDYTECIKKFKQEKVNFNGYNSFSVAKDIQLLKEMIGIDQWVLFGVSYSTTYAMIIAKEYPEMVESMILDSACFPNLKLDHNYLLKQTDSYTALYNYKKNMKDSNESKPIDVHTRMWALHKKLNENPIQTSYLGLKVNGNYFVSSLLWGVYGTEVFKDLSKIINEMEEGKTEAFLPYFKSYIDYLMDKTYADISSMAHYCFEDKPFIDFKKIEKKNMELPKGYIQDNALLIFRANDFCKEMNITSSDTTLADAIETEIPTLFIHGEFDSITPLRDVLTEMKSFKNSKLLTYKTSHSVLGTEKRIENDIADFLRKEIVKRK